MFKSGFVTIVGRPNVGKSTLTNKIMGEKLSIVSNKPQTTRNNIQTILTGEDYQIVFVDTPGIHKPKHKLGEYMVNSAKDSIKEVDLVLFLINPCDEIGKGDKFIIEALKSQNAPVFLVVNKVDENTHERVAKTLDMYSKEYDFKEIIPVSSLKGDNVLDLINTIKKYLSEGEKYYTNEEVTNVTNGFYIAEIVREKLLWLTKSEVPHTVTCVMESYEEYEKYIDIGVLIIVDRENLKKIIIGKGGSMLKKVGIMARSDIEEYLGKKVNLKTYVKVIDNWRDKEKYLTELGLNELK